MSAFNLGQARLVTSLGMALLPLAIASAIWWISRSPALALGGGVLVALTTAGLGFIRQRKITQILIHHLNNLANNNFSYRTPEPSSEIPNELAKLLNRLSQKIEQLNSQSLGVTSVMKAEAGRLRNVINAINDGVLALDKNAHIILFNKAAAKITGYQLAEAAGQPLSQIAPFLHGNELVISDWLSTCEGADIQSKNWENVKLKTKDGKFKTVDIEALYQGTDPNGVRTLITFQDRTGAQELEDMKVDFVALAAHELRTPISVIRGYLEIIQNELGDRLSPEHKQFMDRLNVSASQLSGFINNILHVSRIEHGNLNLKLEAVDWLSLIKTTVHSLKTKANVQHKQLLLELPKQIPKVAVDRLSITEVINNLVDNAIKYSNPNSQVLIKVARNADNIETTVQDRGAGIPENAIGKLFTKFYRSHRTRNSHRGTGLGLYMSKSIIEAHGGTIWVRSKAGTGSTFGFSLPIYEKAVAQHLAVDSNNKIIRGVHGWIKNHSLYRG